MIYLKQSTASQEIPLGYFVDSTDGNTEKTALTIANTDIKIWKSGATTLANKNSGGATHISNGVYYTVLDATDTDTLGPLVVFVHVAGALAVRVECCVLAANVYDSFVAASDKLQVDTVEVSGTSQTAGDIIGDTNDIQARLPAALVAGRMDSSVGAMANDVLTAAAIAADAIGASELAADAVTEIVNAVWAAASRTLTAFGFNVTLATSQLFIKKNTALNAFEFLMRQSADHISPATGLTITAERSIDGAAFAACANAVTEVGNGIYKIDLAAADLNGTVITLKFTAVNADTRYITIITQA